MQLKSFAENRPKEGIVSTIGLHSWKDNKRIYNDDIGTKNNENETKMEDVSDYNKSCSLQTPDSISKRSSYDKLNITWEDCGKMGTRSSSLDTSGIQSNDWSSDTHSDLQNTFLCLSDELATTDYKLDNSQVLLFKRRIVDAILIKFTFINTNLMKKKKYSMEIYRLIFIFIFLIFFIYEFWIKFEKIRIIFFIGTMYCHQ